MKLIWHIFKKDFRRMWVLWACWTLLIIGQHMVGILMLGDGSIERDYFMHLGGIGVLMELIVLVVGYFLVARLIIEDSLVDPKAFWLARPISGWRLLGAKLLSVVLLFMVWPAIVAVPWWTHAGFSLAEIGQAGLQTALLQTVFVLPALVVATLAGSVGRFFLWTLVILVGTVTVVLNALVSPGLTETLKLTRLYLVLTVGGLGGVVAVLIQFGTRRGARSMAVFLTGLGLCAIIGVAWPWDLQPMRPRPGPQLAGTEGVTIDLTRTVGEPYNSRESWVYLSFVAKGLPENLGVVSGWVDLELRWPDGTTIHRRGSFWGNGVDPHFRDSRRWFEVPPEKPDEATERKLAELRAELHERMNAMRAGRGLPPMPDRKPQSPDPNVYLMARLHFPTDIGAKFAESEPAATLVVHLKVGRPVALLQMPLEGGTTRTGQGMRLHLLQTQPRPRKGSDRDANGMVDAIMTYAVPSSSNPIYYFLLNRSYGKLESLGRGGQASFIGPIGLALGWSEAHIPVSRIWRDGQWVDAPERHRDDVLAVVSSRTLGSVDRTITVTHLGLSPKTHE